MRKSIASASDTPRDSDTGRTWWQRRSLRLRLAFWFALIAFVLLMALLPLLYTLTERRLNANLDRQLEIDWSLIEAHLEPDGAGGVRWRRESPSSLDSGGYAESWFDVWEGGRTLMSHRPGHGVEIKDSPTPLLRATRFQDLHFGEDRKARTLERKAQIGDREVILRLFHDKESIQMIQREILVSLGLGVPAAVLLAAAGGYLMAGRALRPIIRMTEQAKVITSDSLSKRLPNPNPHDEIGQLAGVFNGTLERLEGSFEALRRFTGDASHELRTPLTALRSVGEIALRETGQVETLRDTISSMLEEAQRLNDLVDTLLMLARVESGHNQLALNSLSVSEIVAEVCDSLEVLASEKRQQIVLTCDPTVTGMADRVLLRQAVMNILHNAIRYSPPGTTVRVNCESGESGISISIGDEGPGIAAEHQAKIFERFYRIDKARARADGGAGLGLALARLSVEQFGGTIEVASEPGEGSCFTIRLPLPAGITD